jgi:hypothetical protein
MSISGGHVPNQIPQRISWISVQMGTANLGTPTNRHLLLLLPGEMILKAGTGVTILAKLVERAMVNTTQDVGDWVGMANEDQGAQKTAGSEFIRCT